MSAKVLFGVCVLGLLVAGMTPAGAVFQNGTLDPILDPPLLTDGTWLVMDEIIQGPLYYNGWFYVAPWNFSELSPVLFQITDLFVVGDEFEVYDWGTLVLSTPNLPDYVGLGIPAFQSPPYTTDPNTAAADGRFSGGSYLFGAGAHSLTVKAVATPVGFADNTVAFRATVVPEPSTLILLGMGMACTAVAWSRRRRG